MNLLHKQVKGSTAETRIYNALKQAGNRGLYNYELSSPRIGALSWHRRIGDLRADGVNITCVRIKQGVFKYILNDADEILDMD